MILDLDTFAFEHGAKTKEDLIFALRQEYDSATKIASLAIVELQSRDPDLLEYIDREMAWFFDDLGNCFYDCFDGVRNALANGATLATKPTTGDLRGAFIGLPAIVLGAGPGVNARWDLIKASRGRAILIVCDVMLEPCLAHGITPDFVCTWERLPQTYQCMQGVPKDGVTVLAPPVIDPRIPPDFQGRIIWCWRGCGLETWIDPQVPRNNFGRSCGTQGVGVALLAGCSPVYLVGHDLCMDGDQTHCADAQAWTKDTAARLDVDEYHKRMPATSISGRPVTTLHLWGMFKSDIEHIVKEHPWCHVVNTGDGLPIEATVTGELPREWGDVITIPSVERLSPGRDPSELIGLMLADIPLLREHFTGIIQMETADSERMRLTTVVHEKTARVWTEIYGSVYTAALIRINMRPDQHLDMLHRVANAILHTLSYISKELHAL